MGEKTEKPTPKKLTDARKKGQVAKSQDLPAALTFVVSMALTVSLSGYIFQNLSNFFLYIFRNATQIDITHDAFSLAMQCGYVIFLSSIPIVAGVAFTGAVTNFIMVGPLFTTEVFKFDIKKFNPINNLKQKFKLKTLVELLKSLFKITVAGYLCYSTARNAIPTIIQSVAEPIDVCVILIGHFLVEVLIKVGLFFLAVAVADFLYQRKNFEKEMMMEKFEIKQEYKNSEGDPEIKGRRREVAREIAYGGGPPSPKGAKAVVANPTHIAVAIGYEKQHFPAPFVISMGEGAEALWILKEAKQLNIPIIHNIPLARRLYQNGDLFGYIPVDTYEAVAEVLRWIATFADQPG